MFSFLNDLIKDEEILEKIKGYCWAIFNTTGTATMVIEEDKTISLANAEFEKVTGFSRFEIEGKKKWPLFVPKNLQATMEEYHRLRRITPNSAPERYEAQSITRQGETRDILLSVSMIPGTQKSIASFLDITKQKRAQSALRDQSFFLQRMIDSIPNPIFYKDCMGLYQGCNKAFEEFLGKTKKEVIGKSVYDLYPQDLADKYYEMDAALFDEPGVQVYEHSLLYADGTKHDVIFNKATCKNKEGALAGLVGTVVDITERKKAENQLRSLNQRLEDIIDFLPDATFVINKERKVIAWNKAIEKMTGVKKEDILGRGNHAYAIPFYGERRPTLIDLVLKPQEELENNYDYIIRSGDTLITETNVPFAYQGKGAILWGIATLLLDSNRNVIGAIESIRDITGHINAKKALKLSEQRFAQIFNNSPSLMFISTINEGRLVMVNNRFLQVTGYSQEEIAGRTVSDINFWAKPERAAVIKLLQKNGTIDNLECTFREKSGETSIGLYSARIMPLGDEELVLSVVNDISERKRMQEEMSRLERLNLIGEMAAGIGHEIRNPMTTIRGFLQMLGEKQECSKFRNYFSLMIEELDRANSIISEYLSLAKNKAICKKHHNLNDILKALYPLIQADAMRTDMYVQMEPGDIPDLLLDEKEIRQLILNMVRNGLEAMEPGGRITLKTFIKEDKVVLAIQDQGKGIDQDVLNKMGTPFFTTKDSGTGLGLAVCESIALRQNASIRVETGPSGTTFYVDFSTSSPNYQDISR